CIPNTQQCGAGGVQTCIQSGGCTTWGTGVPCQGGTTCHSAGSKAVCCTDACTIPSQKCGPSGGVQTCSMGEVCTTWGPEAACPSGMTCQPSGSGGSCTCPASCTVGAQRCVTGGTGYETCIASGGCPVWGTQTPCAAPKVCQ